MAAKSKLAAATAAITKNILGADVAKPATRMLPQAVSEIHVSPDDVIPANTVITEEIAGLAGFDEDDIDNLVEAGHVKMIEVYTTALASQG